MAYISFRQNAIFRPSRVDFFKDRFFTFFVFVDKTLSNVRRIIHVFGQFFYLHTGAFIPIEKLDQSDLSNSRFFGFWRFFSFFLVIFFY
jgi:hypothetical protein